MDSEKLLRSIPNVNSLLDNTIISNSTIPRSILTDCIRMKLALLRKSILAAEIHTLPGDDDICRSVLKTAETLFFAGIKPVVNGTGVTLHSNLGRACMSEKAAAAAYLAARGYTSLEYDLNTASRGSRTAALEAALRRLTTAEAALVVNNNAAAVLLILSSLAKGGNVIVSRGELVEIGGSFRIPEIIEQCGCSLREIGTTNKTRIEDYDSAIDQNTRAILKVHTSNFRIIGFTESVSVRELTVVSKKHSIPLIEDIGSSTLTDVSKYGIPDVQPLTDSLKYGVDILCFSGDKLLGGPQAGIILGYENYLGAMKKHPLYRALRVDKMTIAALEETIRAYYNLDNAECELPVLTMLSVSTETLTDRAERLCALLRQRGVFTETTAVMSTVGSGSAPGAELESRAVSIKPGTLGLDSFNKRLHALQRPIIGRISKNEFLLDVRTIFVEDLEYVANSVAEVLN